jgi:hypothetical protein
MKKIALFALLALVASCGSSGGGIQVSWTVTVGGAGSTCSAVGAATVKVTVSGPSSTTASVPCTAGSVTVGGLLGGNYTVSVALFDSNGNQQSNPAGVAVTVLDGATTSTQTFQFDFNPTPADGTLSLTWMIAQNGVPSNCAAVTGDTVKLTVTPLSGTANPRVELFDCSAMAGTTDPIPGGDYHIKLDLLNSSNTQLNDVSPTTVIHIDGGDTDLGNFLFNFH